MEIWVRGGVERCGGGGSGGRFEADVWVSGRAGVGGMGAEAEVWGNGQGGGEAGVWGKVGVRRRYGIMGKVRVRRRYGVMGKMGVRRRYGDCLLYTSDAADER